ncbi:substrate-binding periplasmic protein [Pigmentibacter ruber]|uniref:substrate-binding periplasmic protein n=1 Tax=Pigmentibacter ruber TaxID=2683196 RepID=UPI00131CFDEE|nr:transporter substrate-binding domain-containing protein [Pigmentibacter ruber]BFD33160.1 hypothetical protein GTC16762_27780 [Pigmentibacter ruber]
MSIYLRKIILVTFFFIHFNTFAEQKKLIIVTRDYPPYIYQDNNVIKGASAELVKYIFSKLKIKYEIIIQPWNRSHKEIEIGKADIIFTVNKSPERDKIMTYNKEPLILQNMVFFKKKSNDLVFNGEYKNLKNKTIGYTRGAYYGDGFVKGVKENNLTIEESWDYEKCLLKLQSDRYDVIVGSEKVIEYLMKKLNMDVKNYQKLSPKVETIKSYLGFSKKRDYTQLKLKIDHLLMSMKNSGEYEGIVSKNLNL